MASDGSEKHVAYNTELEAIRAIALVRKVDDLIALCEEMQAIAARSTGSERAAIYLVDADRRELVMVSKPFGYEGGLAERYKRAPMVSPILGEVFHTLAPAVFSAATLPEQDRAASIAAGFVEYMVVPLHSDGVLTGILNLARTRNEPYSPELVSLSLAIGDQISVQIERARMLVEEKERNRNLARLNEDLHRSYEELAEAQSELIRRDRLATLGELAVLVAHEVRNPLGVIFNVAAQLRKVHPAEPEKSIELVTILEEEAVRLDRLVRAFLDFGRPVAPLFKPVNVEPLISAAIEIATRAFPAPDLKWEVHVALDAACFHADAQLIREALVSLFFNAAEAQSSSGTVIVRTIRQVHDGRPHLRLSIEDEGATPDAETLFRAFEPFFTTKASGIGLGLAIVKRTVEAHAGEVTIAAREPTGTTVTILLPIDRAKANRL
ncbi:MAG: ATP-binding protein [Polyangiaceae bacterium]